VGCALFLGELGFHLTQCGLAEAYIHAKFHLDPSSGLATIRERDRQDRQDNGLVFLWRTVLQTVAQNWLNRAIYRLSCGLGLAEGSANSIVFARWRQYN